MDNMTWNRHHLPSSGAYRPTDAGQPDRSVHPRSARVPFDLAAPSPAGDRSGAWASGRL